MRKGSDSRETTSVATFYLLEITKQMSANSKEQKDDGQN